MTEIDGSAAIVKGWCPGAWTPMRSGDGLIVRVRPRMARLTLDQARGLARLADRFGSGVIELTRRANVQLRGIRDHDAVLVGLATLGLLDPDPEIEARRNILVTPFSSAGDESERVAERIEALLPCLPPLPAKFGFVVDCGPEPVLGGDPGDVRIERAGQDFRIRADASFNGPIVREDRIAGEVEALIDWFVTHRMPTERRMAQLITRMGGAATTQPGRRLPDRPILAGLPFGQLTAPDLERAAMDCTALRVTPWRMLVLENAVKRPDGFLDPDDPLLAVDACPGAPLCAEASVTTRDVARRLAGRVHSLHVSGCAKGCARSHAADATLIGRDGRFDLVKNGRAGDTPIAQSIAPGEVADAI